MLQISLHLKTSWVVRGQLILRILPNLFVLIPMENFREIVPNELAWIPPTSVDYFRPFTKCWRSHPNIFHVKNVSCKKLHHEISHAWWVSQLLELMEINHGNDNYRITEKCTISHLHSDHPLCVSLKNILLVLKKLPCYLKDFNVGQTLSPTLNSL